MRRFAFLACTGCRYFRPKRLGTGDLLAASPVRVGFCVVSGQPEPVFWPGLEAAVQAAGRCPHRAPLGYEPRCPLFDVTAASGAEGYPFCCIHRGCRGCPFPRG